MHSRIHGILNYIKHMYSRIQWHITGILEYIGI